MSTILSDECMLDKHNECTDNKLGCWCHCHKNSDGNAPVEEIYSPTVKIDRQDLSLVPYVDIGDSQSHLHEVEYTVTFRAKMDGTLFGSNNSSIRRAIVDDVASMLEDPGIMYELLESHDYKINAQLVKKARV